MLLYLSRKRRPRRQQCPPGTFHSLLKWGVQGVFWEKSMCAGKSVWETDWAGLGGWKL